MPGSWLQNIGITHRGMLNAAGTCPGFPGADHGLAQSGSRVSQDWLGGLRAVIRFPREKHQAGVRSCRSSPAPLHGFTCRDMLLPPFPPDGADLHLTGKGLRQINNVGYRSLGTVRVTYRDLMTEADMGEWIHTSLALELIIEPWCQPIAMRL